MPYIDWLLQKLMDEVNHDGPDVVEILYVLRSYSSDVMRRRINAAIYFYDLNFVPQSLREYIIIAIALDDRSISDEQRAKRNFKS